jgi:hypothetical protein
MNKLSLVGMQLPEKCKENFDVSSEGPSSGVTDEETTAFSRNVEILLIFFRLLHPYQRKFVHDSAVRFLLFSLEPTGPVRQSFLGSAEVKGKHDPLMCMTDKDAK